MKKVSLTEIQLWFIRCAIDAKESVIQLGGLDDRLFEEDYGMTKEQALREIKNLQLKTQTAMTNKLNLTDQFLLAGFSSQREMENWIQEFNSMDGEDVLPFFNECCVYKGLAKECQPKEEWVEKIAPMDSGGHWCKPYDGNKYCYNHYRWSFESALRAIGEPQYIIVVNTNSNNKANEKIQSTSQAKH